MVSELVPPDTPEDGLDYLRQNGTMMQLERLARALAQNRPDDVIEYMEHEFAKSRLFVLPQQRYTIPEMEQQISQLATMFDGKVVIQEANGSRSDFITSGRVPIPPHIIETLADCMTFVTDFTQADIIVAPAVRSVASLAHACACRTGQPYSLSIWYPSGLVGDIQIAAVELQGEGRLYINSVTRGQKVIIVGDVLWNGGNSGALLKAVLSVGAIPVAASFVAECSNQNGRQYLTQLAPSMKVTSLVTFDASGSRTKTVKVSGINGASNIRPPLIQYSPSNTEKLLDSKIERVTQSFVGVPILQTPAGYPYCKFCLTDFVPCMSPDLVEDIADCLIAQGNFDEADIIVSSTDRGSAPLAHACGIRSGLPYCFSHWSPITDSEERSNARVTVHIGSMGTMEVSGLTKGSRVMLVADMLSSGGSVEVLCRAIMKNECQVVGAVFASEKVNLNGRQRIRKLNPGIKVASVCRFVAEPADHSVKFSGVRLTEAFQDLKLSLASSRGNGHPTGNSNNSPTAPRGARALTTPQKCKSPPGVLESLRDSLASPPPLPRLSSSNMSPVLSRANRPSSNSSMSSTSSSSDTPPSSANRLASLGLLGFPKLSSSIEISARNKRTGRLQSINPGSFSEEDFSTVVSRVQNIFNDIPVVYSTGLNTPYCYFSLNEGCPPMDPMLMEDIVDCITATTDAISSADILVGMAERATGALVHAIASRTGQPYTLSNWYPKGLQGELVVPMQSTNPDLKMFLNSIHRNHKVAIVGDILWDGTETIALLKAIENGSAYVNIVVFVAEAVNMGGRSRLLQSFPDLEICSVVPFRADEAGTRTYLDSNQSAFERRPMGRKNRLASSADMSSKMERVTQSFVGVTILQTPAGYPYCKFCLTDFVPAMRPDLLEDMAECCISSGNFDEADVIIAEPGRGAGPLVHACALRSKLPYCFASNSRSSSGHVLSSSVGGFHNKGLQLRGLKAGQRVILISDMLSSGSSAETLLRQVVACGCNPVGAVFMSEKVNLNGRRRLQRLFPDMKLVVICKFVAEPADPTLRYVGERLTERFQDLQLDFKKDQTSTSAPAAPRGPRANTPSSDMPIQDL